MALYWVMVEDGGGWSGGDRPLPSDLTLYNIPRHPDGSYNYLRWRITNNINEGKPYPYPYNIISKGDSGGGEGEGDIIPTDNHKDQDRNIRHGNVSGPTGTSSNVFGDSITAISGIAGSAIDCYACTAAEISQIRSDIYTYCANLSSTVQEMFNSVFGRNIFNGILACKAYPVEFGLSSTQNFQIFGQTIGDNNYRKAGATTIKVEFGSVEIGLPTAHSIKDCSFSLYLPYLGTVNLPLTNSNSISITAYVDLLTGFCQYVVKQDDELIMCPSTSLGIDIPLNLSQASQVRNARANVINTAGRMLSNIGGLLGGAAASLGSSMAGDGVGNLISAGNNYIQNQQSEIGNLLAPQTGSDTVSCTIDGSNGAAMCLDPYPRITVKEKVVHNNANGYSSFIGDNYSEYVSSLSTLEGTGLIKCKGFIDNCSTATAAEKELISSLMSQGVII